MAARRNPTLPDRPCEPGGVLLVGINPAPCRSRAANTNYQGRLWNRPRRLGLLDDAASGWDDDAFVAAGNGQTDLVKRPTGGAGFPHVPLERVVYLGHRWGRQ